MLDKRVEADRRMIRMYEQIYSNINRNRDSIILIHNRINDIKQEIKDVNICLLVEDIEYILQSIDYLEVSYKYALGLINEDHRSFFTFTTFYRAIINTISILKEKLHEIIKKNRIMDKDILKFQEEVEILTEKQKEWRNRIEHDIDPFYYGEYQVILEELPISKVIELINIFNELICKLNKSDINTNSLKKIKIECEIIQLKDRKSIIHNSVEVFIRLSEMIIELGYIREKRPLNRKESNLFDLGLKVKELHSLLGYIYIKKNIEQERVYKYFIRMAIVIYYQIFDKIGYYLNDNLSLGLEKNKKYFKEVEKAIQFKELVCKELIFEDEAYGQIKILRQCLIHNKSKFIDYKNDWEKLT